MKSIFKRNQKRQALDTVLKNANCRGLLEKVEREFSQDMTGLVVIIEKGKETVWFCAGMEPAQAILSLDQLHHRVQHEGLPDYD